MAEAEAFASASMTDVIELQLGSLSPEVFAENYLFVDAESKEPRGKK